MKTNLCAILALAATTSFGHAQTTYTWTGAVDGDWANADNWDGNGIPVDDNPGDGLTMPDTDQIVFSGSTMPTSGVPGYGGEYDAGVLPGGDTDPDFNTGLYSSPNLVLNSGGALTMAWNSGNSGIWTNRVGYDREVLTVGDGSGGAGEVMLTLTGNSQRFNRHGNGDLSIRVNSDGVLNTGTLATQRWGSSGARRVFFKIDGGSVNLAGTIGGSNYNDGAWEFLSIGGSVTAQYGGAYADMAAVEGDLGSKFIKNVVGSLFEVTEDLVSDPNTFTVSVVLAPDPNYWTGTGGATWDAATTLNFTTNTEAEALVVDTFANATASSMRATFSDQYFDGGVGQNVTQNSISIAAGGVSTGNVDFSADTVAYDVSSTDTNGIAGATKINLEGTAAVTLTGEHETSGNTSVAEGATLNLGDGATDGSVANSAIANSGALVYHTLSPAIQTGALSGSGTLDKQGAETLTVELASTLSGASTITGGTLRYEARFGSSSVDIGEGTTLELSNADYFETPTVTFTGTGTLLKTNFGGIRTKNASIWQLGSGSLIDVQEGIFRGGSNGNDDYSANMADLNIADGARFEGHEAYIQFDALTGSGTLQTGWEDFVEYNTNLVIGVDNGSGTFDGMIVDNTAARIGQLTKQGTGVQTLNGDNTYTGPTTVQGGELILNGRQDSIGGINVDGGNLELGFDGTLPFVPTANGVTNQIKGTAGAVVLGGVFEIDLSGAAAGAGNSWPLVDPTNLTVTYSEDFLVIDFFEESDGVWTLQDGVALWTFTEATGALTYSVGADARLWTGINGGTWDQSTTANFMNNAPSDPIDNVDFDTALSFADSIGFSDDYFSSGSAIPVGSSSLAIAAGGVEGGSLIFLNIGTDYTVTSSDANGIMGATNISVGSGSVTLIGDHATTGTTTVAASLKLGESGSLASVITGAGGIEKTGAGTWILPADNTYVGSTTVSEGALKLTNNSDTTAVTVASGATLELDFNNRWGGVATYSGEGTILKSGPSNLNFFEGTFELGAGSLIDVQEGRFTASSGGSGGSEIWIDNLSSLNVASGAEFTTAEGNVFLDVITGAGTLATGFSTAGYAQFTIGINNGSGSFDGDLIDHAELVGDEDPHYGHIHKVGTGTQTFNGRLAIRGDYDVQDGSVTVGDIGSITFYPADNGATNQVFSSVDTGIPVANLDGSVYFDFNGTDTTPGNAWTIIDLTTLTVNLGATFGVTSTVGSFSDMGAGLWQLDAGGNLWSFDVPTATLSVEEGTEVGYMVFQTTYFTEEQINAGDADEDVDFDGGGLENGIEFVVGGDPTDGSDDAALAPTAVKTDTGYEFSFRRTLDSAADNPGVEYSNDLDGFSMAVDGVDGVTITVDSNFYGGGVDRVVVFLPDSLSVDGKIFARLAVTPGL